MDRIDPKTSLLLVIDIQERLVAAMPAESIDRAIANVLVLLETARLLGVAVVASEQYPRGLGPTVESVADKLRDLGVAPMDKLTFDAAGEPRIASAIAERSPRSVVIVGVEAHVCVFQTARELARRGVDTRVVADAVASRRDDNRALGLSMCERAGAVAMPTEGVIFDWLGRAGTGEFRAVSKLLQ